MNAASNQFGLKPFLNRRRLRMFADRAKIFIRSGKAAMDM